MLCLVCRTSDGEQRVGLCLLGGSDTLQGVVLRELFGDIQSAFHLTPTKGWLWKDCDLRGLQLGSIGQLWAPVERLRLLKVTRRFSVSCSRVTFIRRRRSQREKVSEYILITLLTIAFVSFQHSMSLLIYGWTRLSHSFSSSIRRARKGETGWVAFPEPLSALKGFHFNCYIV